jgi:hypothetical protein
MCIVQMHMRERLSYHMKFLNFVSKAQLIKDEMTYRQGQWCQEGK